MNPKIFFPCLWLCVVTALLSASTTVHADAPIVVVVTNGTPAPEGNGSIDISYAYLPAILPVVINDAGQVAFEAFLDGALGGTNNTGIYRGDAISGDLTNIVRQGQAAPDGNGKYDSLIWLNGTTAYPPCTV